MPNSKPSNHILPQLILFMNPFSLKTTYSITTNLMSTENGQIIYHSLDGLVKGMWLHRLKVAHESWMPKFSPSAPKFRRSNYISWKPQRFITKTRPVTMKISTCHHENLDLSSWKSRTDKKARLDIIKITSSCHKFSTCRHKNLDLSSLKFRPLILKSWPAIVKI